MKRLPRSVYHAINQEMTPRFNRWARKHYRMSGKRLIAKLYAGEGGGSIDEGSANTSSAGAFGPGQFIRSTRDGYVKQHGVDPWKNDRSAVRATMIYLQGGSVASYNPGMPSYESYVLGQHVDTRPLRTGSVGGKRKRASRSDVLSTQRTGGFDFEAERNAARMEYLDQRGRPGALLQLGLNLRGLEDVPGGQLTMRSSAAGSPSRPDGRRTRTASGQVVGNLIGKATKWSKAGVPYLWGGGHGSIAKVGDRVDCSGFVSAMVGLDTPLVSGQLMHWGRPGKGRWVTVYASPTHTFMSIRDPRTRKLRWFGTSKSNPGGGPGEISRPSASYLRGFAARHPG